MRRYSKSQTVTAVSRLSVTLLRRFVAADCVRPTEDDGEVQFTEADLARIELLLDLSETYDFDEDALSLVMGLIEQLHGMRREIRALGRAIDEEHEDARARLRAAYARHRAG